MKPVLPRTDARALAFPSAARFVAAAACIALLLCAAWASARDGASRFAASHSVSTGSAAEAELAVRLAPADPEAHFALAWLLSQAGDLDGATRAYERALTLRPGDHVLWLELGKTRDRAGDSEGALKAFVRSVESAPYYAQPRWQLGNCLLRAGRREEALEELRRAAESDASLYPNFLQTIWQAEGRDAQALARAARPKTPAATLALVRFLVRAGAAGEGMAILRASGATLPETSRRDLLSDLLAAGDFESAYAVWSEHDGSSRGSVTDGGFEEATRTDDEGFGWQFARGVAALNFSLDSDSPRQGARSLRVEFAGGSDPAIAAVSQLVLVEPGARYRLSFAARARELVTGGPPFLRVDSAAKSAEPLVSSPPLRQEGAVWRDYAVEFIAPKDAGAVRISLRRLPCATSPCPAFGSIWLDSFEMNKL